MRLDEARLYLVHDGDLEIAEAALRGGADIIQLRVKETPDDELLERARALRRLCTAHGALFIVNDSAELAVRVDADGVHVGQDDLPVAEARRIVGSDRIVGLSTHSAAQIEAAESVDYIAVGPVFATPTKPGRPAVGLELVQTAARTATVPWFAIGGIDEGNVDDVRAAGATRIAVVRAVARAPDAECAARALRDRLSY
ncbi:MAG TPA: thiamine phosphate synthase [Gaiellaceae bacterium]